MNKKLFFVFLPFLFSGFAQSLLSQTFTLSGKIIDKETQMPVPQVFVVVNNTDNKNEDITVLTDQNGNFSIPKLKPHAKYKLNAKYLGYTELELPIESDGKNIDLGSLFLSIKTHDIQEVTVRGDPPSAVQKGDTTEMNAEAFKVNPNATTEDLLTKMPGITSENGKIKAHGEEVKKVLVDGKDFFGDDPSIALKSLPADVVDKIQIFDKLSEQAQFTGFDDGTSSKTINIITKQSKKNGEFGKFFAGTDFSDKYIVGGSLNLFDRKQRISILGIVNNINQQNFSSQDLESIPGSTSGKHDGGFVVGQQNGITKTNAFGLNYSNSWKKKVILTGSYFFNNSKNNTIQTIKKEKFLLPRADHFSTENDTIASSRFNHRISMRLDYTIDSMNSITIIPKVNFLISNSNKFMTKYNSKNPIDSFTNPAYDRTHDILFVNSAWADTKDKLNGYTFDNEIVFKHKFNKPRRTFSISVTTIGNHKDPTTEQTGELYTDPYQKYQTDQSISGYTNSFKITSNLIYIEPLSNISMLQFNITNAYTSSKADRDAYFYFPNPVILYNQDTTNLFKTNYINNHFGVSYRIKSEKLKLSIGFEYQIGKLTAAEMYPTSSTFPKPIHNFLPNFLLNYKYSSKTSLRIQYKTSTDAPNISQLQNAIDNSGVTNLATGNPYLTQEYTNNLTLKYSFANPETSINYNFFLSGEYSTNYIGYHIYTPDAPVTVQPVNVYLTKNLELDFPVNLDHFINLRWMFNYSFPLKWMACKLNLVSGFNYSQTPGLINGALNRYNLYSTTGGFTLSSDISEKVDFAITYTSNYSIIENTLQTSLFIVNPRYWYHSAGAKISWVFGQGFIMQSDMLGQCDKGFRIYNQDYLLWNASFGKKFLKNQDGELKLSVFDLLNKNRTISHTVTPQSILDNKINHLQRYFMLTFTYNLNAFHGEAEPQKIKKSKNHKKKNE